MCQGLKDLDVAKLKALNKIQPGKEVMAGAYNKKVKHKSFMEGDLVWKAILPLRAQVRGFGKYNATWEGQLTISQVLDYLTNLEGNFLKNPLNGKYLKIYHPTLWDVRDCYIEQSLQTFCTQMVRGLSFSSFLFILKTCKIKKHILKPLFITCV